VRGLAWLLRLDGREACLVQPQCELGEVVEVKMLPRTQREVEHPGRRVDHLVGGFLQPRLVLPVTQIAIYDVTQIRHGDAHHGARHKREPGIGETAEGRPRE